MAAMVWPNNNTHTDTHLHQHKHWHNKRTAALHLKSGRVLLLLPRVIISHTRANMPNLVTASACLFCSPLHTRPLLTHAWRRSSRLFSSFSSSSSMQKLRDLSTCPVAPFAQFSCLLSSFPTSHNRPPTAASNHGYQQQQQPFPSGCGDGQPAVATTQGWGEGQG